MSRKQTASSARSTGTRSLSVPISPSTVRRAPSSEPCPYTSPVMLMLLCPNRSATSFFRSAHQPAQVRQKPLNSTTIDAIKSIVPQ
jgi:hypothetical protein